MLCNACVDGNIIARESILLLYRCVSPPCPAVHVAVCTAFYALCRVYTVPCPQISDILRVHEYEYVRKILCAVGQTHALAAQKQQRSAASAAAAASSSSPSSCDVTHHHRLDTSSSSAAAPSDVSLHHLDSDTAVSQSSWEAALRAAGAVCAAADRVIAGRNVNAFCPIRPPGERSAVFVPVH